MNISASGAAESSSEVNEYADGHGHAHGSLAKLMAGAVGIVFGDIGT